MPLRVHISKNVRSRFSSKDNAVFELRNGGDDVPILITRWCNDGAFDDVVSASRNKLREGSFARIA